MSIVLDPSKSFVQITMFFIEEKKKNGNSVFHFIKTPEEMEEWRSKGYKTKDEYTQQAQQQQISGQNPAAIPQSLAQNIQKAIIIPADAKIIEKISTTWKRMTWKEQNIIFSQSLRVIGNESEIDALKYRELKLKQCLKKWDARDDEGNLINLTPEVIDNLCPEVASELLRAFERVTEPSDEELKN